MLGKLIKNDFKASAYTMGFVYIAMAATVGLLMLAYLLDISWIKTAGTIALAVVGIVANIVTFVFIISNFKKTLYGPQGYLSFTLPVTSNQLLFSKLFTSCTWMLISYGVALGIWVGVFYYVKDAAEEYMDQTFGEELAQMFTELVASFTGVPSAVVIKALVVFFAMMLFMLITVFIALLYFSITCSNIRLFQKMGGLTTVIVFFVLIIASVNVFTWLTENVALYVAFSEEGTRLLFDQYAQPVEGELKIEIAGFIFCILEVIGAFFATSYLMEKKVNLK